MRISISVLALALVLLLLPAGGVADCKVKTELARLRLRKGDYETRVVRGWKRKYEEGEYYWAPHRWAEYYKNGRWLVEDDASRQPNGYERDWYKINGWLLYRFRCYMNMEE